MTDAAAEDWCKSLVKVPYQGLQKEQIVYERVRYAGRDNAVKWKKARVLETNRNGAKVIFLEDGREAMLTHSAMWYEPPQPEPKRRVAVRAVHESEPAPAPAVTVAKVAGTDDEYRAWVAMGHDMLAAIDRQRTAVEQDLREVTDKIDTIDRNARARIESLEAELTEAKREHQNDRAFMAVRHEQLETKLASLNDRRQAMAQLMGET